MLENTSEYLENTRGTPRKLGEYNSRGKGVLSNRGLLPGETALEVGARGTRSEYWRCTRKYQRHTGVTLGT